MTGRPWLPWKVAMAARVLRPSRAIGPTGIQVQLRQQLLDFPDLGAGGRPVRRDCRLRGSRGRRRQGCRLAEAGWRRHLDRSIVPGTCCGLPAAAVVWAGARRPASKAACSLASACFPCSSPALAAIRYQPAAITGLGGPSSPAS